MDSWFTMVVAVAAAVIFILLVMEVEVVVVVITIMVAAVVVVGEVSFFVAYLIMLSVSKSIQHQMAIRYMNNKHQRI
jgi:hypothetical protein